MKAVNSRNGIQIAVLAIGLSAVGLGTLGCSTTRMGSLPKMNLAWWKKNPPGIRHDEAPRPSVTMSPAAEPASDGASLASKPQRAPYEVDGATPPRSRTFDAESAALSATSNASTPPATALLAPPTPVGSASTTSSPNPSATLPRFELPRIADSNDSTGGIANRGAAEPPTSRSQTLENPYATSQSPAATPGSMPAASSYPTTPHGEFSPKLPSLADSSPMQPPTTAGTPLAGRLQPMPNGLTPSSALGAIAAPQLGTASASSRVPNATGSSAPPSLSPSVRTAAATLPALLTEAQGSYAPGSIGGAIPIPSATPASSAAPDSGERTGPPAPAPTSSTTHLQGGGSFRMLK